MLSINLVLGCSITDPQSLEASKYPKDAHPFPTTPLELEVYESKPENWMRNQEIYIQYTLVEDNCIEDGVPSYWGIREAKETFFDDTVEWVVVYGTEEDGKAGGCGASAVKGRLKLVLELSVEEYLAEL